MKFQIFHRYDSARVVYECELPDKTPSGLRMRAALGKATVMDANLTRADLTRANLTRANLMDANLTRADLTGADLTGANLTDANLTRAKNDFWSILLRTPQEVAGLRLALIDGRVDGSTYKGACACLVGTIANLRGLQYRDIGVKPDSNRPAERWFLGIRKGDTPETNQISKITVEWLDEFVSLLAAAQVPA